MSVIISRGVAEIKLIICVGELAYTNHYSTVVPRSQYVYHEIGSSLLQSALSSVCSFSPRFTTPAKPLILGYEPAMLQSHKGEHPRRERRCPLGSLIAIALVIHIEKGAAHYELSSKLPR
jgi:hypothetical protein